MGSALAWVWVESNRIESRRVHGGGGADDAGGSGGNGAARGGSFHYANRIIMGGGRLKTLDYYAERKRRSTAAQTAALYSTKFSTTAFERGVKFWDLFCAVPSSIACPAAVIRDETKLQMSDARRHTAAQRVGLPKIVLCNRRDISPRYSACSSRRAPSLADYDFQFVPSGFPLALHNRFSRFRGVRTNRIVRARLPRVFRRDTF